VFGFLVLNMKPEWAVLAERLPSCEHIGGQRQSIPPAEPNPAREALESWGNWMILAIYDLTHFSPVSLAGSGGLRNFQPIQKNGQVGHPVGQHPGQVG